MAIRPIFLPAPTSSTLVQVLDIQFEWHPRFSSSQKAKSRDSMHRAANTLGLDNILEVSSKSDRSLGKALSAFNLIRRRAWAWSGKT
jgi:hypothetical protein